MADRLVLISDDEKAFPMQFGESTIWIVRLEGGIQEKIIRKHDKKGKTNWTGAMYDMVAEAITRWDNIPLDGKVVPWERKHVRRIPRDAIDELAEALGANIPGMSSYQDKAESDENLLPTSDSSPSTQD